MKKQQVNMKVVLVGVLAAAALSAKPVKVMFDTDGIRNDRAVVIAV